MKLRRRRITLEGEKRKCERCKKERICLQSNLGIEEEEYEIWWFCKKCWGRMFWANMRGMREGMVAIKVTGEWERGKKRLEVSVPNG